MQQVREYGGFSALPVGVLVAAVVSKRAISAYLNGRRLRQKTAARSREATDAKERFAARFRGKAITDHQRHILSMGMEEMRQKLQDGELTAAEVLEAFQAKAVEVDARTNAITEYLEDAADRARELDALPKDKRGPLHGVPVSLKVRRPHNLAWDHTILFSL